MTRKLHEYLLIPFAGIYGLIVILRNQLFDWQVIKSQEFDIPVISVGNLVAGGTGKTPHIEFLAEYLKDDYQIAVLSRGYRRKTKGFILADSGSGPDQIGDEPCQIKQKFPSIMVAVDENRVHGIEELLKQSPAPEVILLDDAFQHRFVKAGLNILLDDYSRSFQKDFLLPAGRLREPASGKKRADIILVTKTPPELKAISMRIRAMDTRLNKFQHLFFTSVKAGNPVSVFDGSYPEKQNHNPDILILSGIAKPESLRALAGLRGTIRKELKYPDHHHYTLKDIDQIIRSFNTLDPENRVILTTEKDAVKLYGFAKELVPVKDYLFFLPLQIEVLNNDKNHFLSQISNYVKNHSRDRFLHSEED